MSTSWRTFPRVTVGDRLLLVRRYGSDGEEVVVVRVGRKYLYTAEPGGAEKLNPFLLETGMEAHWVSGYQGVLYTPEQYEERAERRELFQQLNTLKITVAWSAHDTISTAKLRGLLAVMQKED